MKARRQLGASLDYAAICWTFVCLSLSPKIPKQTLIKTFIKVLPTQKRRIHILLRCCHINRAEDLELLKRWFTLVSLTQTEGFAVEAARSHIFQKRDFLVLILSSDLK